MRQIMDNIFNEILQGIKKKWPSLIDDINELEKIPSHLPLNVFPCYRQTLYHINKNCFPLSEAITILI